MCSCQEYLEEKTEENHNPLNDNGKMILDKSGEKTKLHYMKNLGLAFILLLATSLSVQAAEKPDTCDIKGKFDYRIKNDTVYIIYTLYPENFQADSFVIKCSAGHTIIAENNPPVENHLLIYKTGEPLPFENNWRKCYLEKDQLILKGEIKIPMIEDWFWVGAEGRYTDQNDEEQSFDRSIVISKYWLSFGMECWAPSFGYFKSDKQPHYKKEGIFLGYGFSWQINGMKWKTELSTSWTGLGPNFSFSEPFRLNYTFYTGTRNNYMPHFFAGGKFSKLKLKKGDNKFYNTDWGAEVGVGIEGPFERLSYTYSTNQDGYHTFELFLPIMSSDNAKMGTRFVFQKSKDVWLIRAGIHLDGLQMFMAEPGSGKLLGYKNNRTFIQKGLSYAFTVPLIPIYLIFGAFDKNNN